MDKKILIIAIIVLIVVGGGAFYGGVLYQKSQTPARGNLQAFNRTGRTGTAGGNFVTGSVIAKDATSITLQLPGNAGSKIVFYSGTTQISKMASGTPDDLANGTNVTITGTANSDGSVTAQNIQIRPAPAK